MTLLSSLRRLQPDCKGQPSDSEDARVPALAVVEPALEEVAALVDEPAAKTKACKASMARKSWAPYVRVCGGHAS